MKRLMTLAILLQSFVCHGVKIAVGDEKNANQTFDFAVGKVIYNSESAALWTASGEDINAKDAQVQDFGLSVTPLVSGDGKLDTKLKALAKTTEKAVETTFGTEQAPVVVGPEITNPLRGKKINSLTMIGSLPAVVLDGFAAARYVYGIQEIVFDESGSAKNKSILFKHDLGVHEQAVEIAGIGSNVFYASAEKDGATATFGTDPSSIGFLSWNSAGVGSEGEKKVYNYLYGDAKEAIDVSNVLLKAGTTNLAALGGSVAFYPYGSNMLIGFDMIANGNGGDCAVAIIVAKPTPATRDDKGAIKTVGSLAFSSIIPDAVATAGFNTVCSARAGEQVAIRHMSVTTTTTGLSYLLVARDNGAGQQTVYAVPLVTQAASADDNGKIAKFGSIKKKFQITGTWYRQQGFDTVIDDAEEIDIAGAQNVLKRIQVGQGVVPVAAGSYIKQLFSQGDCVYIAIGNAYAVGTTPGLFKSQALFDKEGRIISWTPWQRIAGTDEKMLFAMQNSNDRRIAYVTEGVAGSGTFDTVKQTVWSAKDNKAQVFLEKVDEQLSNSIGGVQAMFGFSGQTSGFNNAGDPQLSLYVATGKNQVVVGQTGYQNAGHFKPKSMGAGDLVALDAADGLDIDSIVAAEFGNDGIVGNNWLFLGGNKGLAVLADAGTGIGWAGGLATVADLTAAGQTCRSLGDFAFIKKLASDGAYLYILTLDALYRIALDPNKFKAVGADPLNAVEVVKAKDLNIHASLLDVIVDDELVLLGSTAGMYTIDDSGRPGAAGAITKVEVPGGLSAVSRFVTLSDDAHVTRKFKAFSNLYVLTNDFGVEQSRINRFTISAGVLNPIQDQLLEDENYALLVFDYFKNNICIDGGLGFATAYKIASDAPVVKVLMPSIQGGKSSCHVLLSMHTQNLVLSSLASATNLVGVVQDFAAGASLIGGDFGILMNA